MTTSAGAVKSDPLKGFVFSLTSTILGATFYVTAKVGLQGFNPETFGLVWTAASTIFVTIIIILSSQARQIILPRQAVRGVGLFGLAAGVGMILNWAGLALLDPSFTSFLFRFVPVLVIFLGALLFRERLSSKEIAPAALMIVGGMLCTVGRWHIVATGMILILLSCLAGATQTLLAKAKVADVHPNILTFYRSSIAALVITAWLLITGKADFNVAPSYWLVTIAGALLAPCIGTIISLRSYLHWEVSRASIIRTTEPLFVIPLAYLVFGNLPAGMELVGGAVILAGAIWLGWVQSRLLLSNRRLAGEVR